MANIILRDDKGDFQTYEGIKTVSFNNDEGTLSTFSEDVQKTPAWHAIQQYLDDKAVTTYTLQAAFGKVVTSTDSTFGIWVQTEYDAMQLYPVGAYTHIYERYDYIIVYSNHASGDTEAPSTGGWGLHVIKADLSIQTYMPNATSFNSAQIIDPVHDVTNPGTLGYIMYSSFQTLTPDRGAVLLLPTQVVYIPVNDDYTGSGNTPYTLGIALNSNTLILNPTPSADYIASTKLRPVIVNYTEGTFQYFSALDLSSTTFPYFAYADEVQNGLFLLRSSQAGGTYSWQLFNTDTNTNTPLSLPSSRSITRAFILHNNLIYYCYNTTVYTYNILTGVVSTMPWTLPGNNINTVILSLSNFIVLSGVENKESAIYYSSGQSSYSGAAVIKLDTQEIISGTIGYYANFNCLTDDGSVYFIGATTLSTSSTAGSFFVIDTVNNEMAKMTNTGCLRMNSVLIRDTKGTERSTSRISSVYFTKPDTLFYYSYLPNSNVLYKITSNPITSTVALTSPVAGSTFYSGGLFTDDALAAAEEDYTQDAFRRILYNNSDPTAPGFILMGDRASTGVWLLQRNSDEITEIQASTINNYCHSVTNIINGKQAVVGAATAYDGYLFSRESSGSIVYESIQGLSSGVYTSSSTRYPVSYIETTINDTLVRLLSGSGTITYTIGNTTSAYNFLARGTSTTYSGTLATFYYPDDFGGVFIKSAPAGDLYATLDAYWLYLRPYNLTARLINTTVGSSTFTFLINTNTGALFTASGNTSGSSGIRYLNKTTESSGAVWSYGNAWAIQNADYGRGLFYLYRPNFTSDQVLVWDDNTQTMSIVTGD